MSRLVIDASVAAKWFLVEHHTEDARRLLSSGYQLLAPETMLAEFANILWKRIRTGEITEQIAEVFITTLLQMPVQFHADRPLLLSALAIAAGYERSVYDSLYLALAVAQNAHLVTADAKLFNSLRSTPLAAHLVWVDKVQPLTSQ